MADRFFSPGAKDFIVNEISSSSDNEVFFVGSLGEGDLIEDVEVVARGNKFSVPAIIDSAVQGQTVIHNHPSGNLTPSEQDIYMASIFGNDGVGFYIIDNSLNNIYVVVEPFRKKQYGKLDLNELESLLSEKSGVADVLGENYEFRKEQIDVMKEFANSFNDNSISIVEAGTGTGKTFSYLIPSIKWSILNNERVIVSTNTINLQEQLINKDLPLIKESLNEDFNYSLVKGMKNYLCLLRADTVGDGLFDLTEEGEEDEVENILKWVKNTQDGSLSDLSFSPSVEVWDKFAAESESCLRTKCVHYSKCFFFKARREMSSSQILVVNHHLFFSDLAIKDTVQDKDVGILPSYNRVIFDEGHNVVDAATSHFSLRAAKYGLLRVMSRLKNRSKRGDLKGLVYYAATSALKLPDNLRKSAVGEVLTRTEEVLSPRIDNLVSLIEEAFDSLYSLVLLFSKDESQTNSEYSLRVVDKVTDSDDWKEVKKKFKELNIHLTDLHRELKSLLEVLEEYEDEDDFSKLVIEFRGVSNKIIYYSEVIDSFFNVQDDSYVKWVECKKRKNVLSAIGLSPISVSEHLGEKLYSHCKTIIFTSATLAVEKNFNFQKKQLGLDNNNRLKELLVPSPFNYKEQTLLVLPNDIPEPADADFNYAVTHLIFKALTTSKGNALVLFTSYSLLDSVYSDTQMRLNERDLVVLKQGSMPRHKLIRRFIENRNSVLFATDSFWEGVDIPGDSLKLVIITRLPFRVPTDPVVEAKVDFIESQGLNPFFEYLVPLAVLKFKQGFGRLIRTKNDRGAVMVFDKRIQTKNYGKYFINSLPECKKIYGSFEGTLDAVKSFLST